MKKIIKSIFIFSLFTFISFAQGLNQDFKSVLQDDIFGFDVLSIFFGDIHFNGQFALKGLIDKGAVDIDFLYHPESSYTSYYQGVKMDWEKKYGEIGIGFNYFFGVAPYGFYLGPYFAYFSEKFTGPNVPPNTNITTIKYGDYRRKNTILGIQAGFNYIFKNNITLGVKAKYPIIVFGDDPIAQPPEEYVKSPKGYIFIGYKF